MFWYIVEHLAWYSLTASRGADGGVLLSISTGGCFTIKLPWCKCHTRISCDSVNSMHIAYAPVEIGWALDRRGEQKGVQEARTLSVDCLLYIFAAKPTSLLHRCHLCPQTLEAGEHFPIVGAL